MMPAPPTLMWPYVMPMPGMLGACGPLCCSRPPLTVLALVGAGLGLPLSEEVLVLGLGSQLPELSASRRLCVLVWTLVGIVFSDLATVSLGATLRARADTLKATAPRFFGRLLKSIAKQLDLETRRDAKRLEQQLGRRLRATAASAADLLRSMRDTIEPGAPTRAPSPQPPPIEPAALRLTVLRRFTCNTRTALASAGQAGPRLLGLLASAPRREQRRRRTASSGPSRAAASFSAAVDNRFGLGQRWPLALLTGLDGPVAIPSYALGSAVAALGGTLPATLGAGVLLRSQGWVVTLIAASVALAQACRFGPLWYAIGRAVSDEVRDTASRSRLGRLRGGACAIPRPISLSALANSVSDACSVFTPQDEWITPEDAGWVARQAIRALRAADASPDHPAPPEDALALPLQGEMRFDELHVAHSERYATAEAKAYEGDGRAQQTLGLLLYSGVGGAPCDVRASAEWHAAAAAQGNVDALAVLGGCLRKGVGAEVDEQTGVDLITAAAEAGSPVGLVKLAALYEDGAGGYPADSWRSAKLFERAANLGSALGYFNHGWAKIHGLGTTRDLDAGVEAWRMAMSLAPDDGAEEAAFNLYAERKLLTSAQTAQIKPVACLRLSASLGYDKAVRVWRARQERRALGPDPYALKRTKGERFIRDDKSRAWTEKDSRTEKWLDGDE